MRAFHGDPRLKSQLIEMARQHRVADEYIAGTYADDSGDTFRGCSVGCTVRDINDLTGESGGYADHAYLAEQLGVPEFVTRLQDAIFEGLPQDQRSGWTERLLTAIPEGADLTPALPRFLLTVQERNAEQIDREASPDVYAAALQVLDVLRRWVDTGGVDGSAVWSARSAALAAEESAALASFVTCPRAAARWAEAAAALAAEESVEESAEYERMADDLIAAVERCGNSASPALPTA